MQKGPEAAFCPAAPQQLSECTEFDPRRRKFEHAADCCNASIDDRQIVPHPYLDASHSSIYAVEELGANPMLRREGPVKATARRLNRSLRIGAGFITGGLLALSMGPAAVGAAATPGQTSFTFSGTVKGTLTTANTSCTEQVVTAKGATFILMGTLKGSPATKWTIQLYAPKAGTSKNFGQENGEGPNVTLIGEDSNGNDNWNWTSTTKNGSITTTKTSGKVNIVLGPYSSFRGKPGKGKVHVVGSWGCTS